MTDFNNYIYINNKLFEITDRKYSDKKFRSKERSINGTLTVDSIGENKVQLQFTFDCNERQLLRIHTIWEANSALTLIDVDDTSYSCACTSQDFSPEHVIRNDTDYFIIPLTFEQI